MVNYVNRISTLAADPADGSTDGLIDETDKMHTGIVKAIEARNQGNYVISFGTLVQTDGGSNTTLTINSNTTDLVYKRKGKVYVISGGDKTINMSNRSSSTRYDMLVITDHQGTLAIRTGTLDGTNAVIPDLTLGDVPVALIQVTSDAANDATGRLIQFFGRDKREDEITVAYSNSGAYAKTATITAASGVATIQAESSCDVKVKLAGTAAGDTFEVTDSADQVQFKVQGDGAVSVPNGTFTAGTTVIQSSDSSTNSVVFPMKVSEITSGTPANGLGVGVEFEVETSAGNNEIGATIAAVTTDVSSGSEDFKIVFKAMSAGNAATEMLSLTANNVITPAGGRIITPAFGYAFGGGVYVSGSSGSKGTISFSRIAILDVRNSSNNYFELPNTSGVESGQMITLKNPTTASAIISPVSGQEIDFGETTNALIGSANVLTLTTNACVTLMCYKSWDKGNLTDNNGLGLAQDGWLVISQTA